jgi:hypothetical protein
MPTSHEHDIRTLPILVSHSNNPVNFLQGAWCGIWNCSRGAIRGTAGKVSTRAYENRLRRVRHHARHIHLHLHEWTRSRNCILSRDHGRCFAPCTWRNPATCMLQPTCRVSPVRLPIPICASYLSESLCAVLGVYVSFPTYLHVFRSHDLATMIAAFFSVSRQHVSADFLYCTCA